MVKKAAIKKIVTKINEQQADNTILPLQEVANNDFPLVVQEAVSHHMGKVCQKSKSFNYESSCSLLQYLVDCCKNIQEYNNSDYIKNTNKILRESNKAVLSNYLEAKANIVANNEENYKNKFANIGLLMQNKCVDSISKSQKQSLVANAEVAIDNLSVLNNALNNFCKEVLYPLSSYSNQLILEARKKRAGFGD
jgi:hypothetical protein